MFNRDKKPNEVTTPSERLEGTGWRNRIVGEGFEAPDQLLANPRNWRIHPGPQQDALIEALETVGWVKPIIVNRTTQHVVDGHLRVAVSISKGEAQIPVSYVELTPEEEALILMTLDPISELAGVDKEIFKMLATDGVQEGWLTDGALSRMIKAMIPGEADPPDEWNDPEEDDATEGEYRCPKCAYEWKGKPR